MSTAAPETAHHDQDTAHHERPHPKDIFYVKIAAALAAMTALEVSTYFWNYGKVFLPLLLVLMSIKFVMVVLFFMHARFDAKVFGRLFWTGLTLALAVYIAALSMFHFWKA